MIYARVLDQTLAEDYFAAMERVEQRLNITQELTQQIKSGVVKDPTRTHLLVFVEQLTQPELR